MPTSTPFEGRKSGTLTITVEAQPAGSLTASIAR